MVISQGRVNAEGEKLLVGPRAMARPRLRRCRHSMWAHASHTCIPTRSIRQKIGHRRDHRRRDVPVGLKTPSQRDTRDLAQGGAFNISRRGEVKWSSGCDQARPWRQDRTIGSGMESQSQ